MNSMKEANCCFNMVVRFLIYCKMYRGNIGKLANCY